MDRLLVYQHGGMGMAEGFSSGTEALYSGVEDMGGTGVVN